MNNLDAWNKCYYVDKQASTAQKLVFRKNIKWNSVVETVCGFVQSNVYHFWNSPQKHRSNWEDFWKLYPTAKFPFEWQLRVEELEVLREHFVTLEELNELLDYLPNVRRLRIVAADNDGWRVRASEMDSLIDMIVRLPLLDVDVPVDPHFQGDIRRCLLANRLWATLYPTQTKFPVDEGLMQQWHDWERGNIDEQSLEADEVDKILYKRGDAERRWFEGDVWAKALFKRPPHRNVLDHVTTQLRMTGAYMNSRLAYLFHKTGRTFLWPQIAPAGHPYPQMFLLRSRMQQ